jgi:hypothetical protein
METTQFQLCSLIRDVFKVTVHLSLFSQLLYPFLQQCTIRTVKHEDRRIMHTYLSVLIPQQRQLMCQWVFTTRNLQCDLHTTMKYIVVILHPTCESKVFVLRLYHIAFWYLGNAMFEFN